MREDNAEDIDIVFNTNLILLKMNLNTFEKHKISSVTNTSII